MWGVDMIQECTESVLQVFQSLGGSLRAVEVSSGLPLGLQLEKPENALLAHTNPPHCSGGVAA